MTSGADRYPSSSAQKEFLEWNKAYTRNADDFVMPYPGTPAARFYCAGEEDFLLADHVKTVKVNAHVTNADILAIPDGI